MTFAKPRAFFFHYNKPLSRQQGIPQITVHIGGACHVVDNVVCAVPTKGRIRRRQPFFVMTGMARTFVQDAGVGYLR